LLEIFALAARKTAAAEFNAGRSHQPQAFQIVSALRE
jgi:hypothetical protein